MSEIDQLKQKAQSLKERLDQIHADYRRGLNRDSEERAQELENAEVLNEIERVTSQDLEKVLAKIALLEQR